jgi:ABC-type polysaccharide/polyol phosphate transport system, ATPase component
MSDVVIKVDQLSKQYRLGKIGTGSFAHDVNRWWHKIRGKEDPYLKVGETNDRANKGKSEYVWSLKDISFEVKAGEAVGVIGRNGAGKSTLLKILSRVTVPTIGSVKVKGRIASLLEVGTGFHPELTGRENIFLNGAILGMTKKEIRRKFDEIVDFAGVERYIDTPVKRYSSGMYVRLAFGVAAHLEPEILIVDEVLAVGDAEFQKKALGKMQDVSREEGRTVLFVSHNMSAIKKLCTTGIVLKNGELNFAGKIDDVMNHYLNGMEERASLDIKEINRAGGNGSLRFVNIDFLAKDGTRRREFAVGEPIEVVVHFVATEEFYNNKNSIIDIGINDFLGNRVTWLSTSIYKDRIEKGRNFVRFMIDGLLLNQGSYNVSLYCNTDLGVADWIQNASRFEVFYEDFFGTGRNVGAQGFVVTKFKID